MDKLPDDYKTLSSIGTGYSLTFSEFQSVLKNALPSAPIPLLLKEWFRVTVETTDEGLIKGFIDNHMEVDLHAIYSQIQDNPEMQFTFYQRAMDIWR